MGSQSNYALRLPSSLKTGAEQAAREDGTILNQFIVCAVAEKLSALKTSDFFLNRSHDADVKEALALLNRDGGQAPAANDKLAARRRK